MKKISTLALMAFFFCLISMAQVVLGDINFSLGEGKKINPATGKITVTFPNVQGVADPTTTSFVLAGAFNENDFDGVEGTFATGVTFDLAEFELQPATDYTLKITSVKVDGTELAPEGAMRSTSRRVVLSVRWRGLLRLMRKRRQRLLLMMALIQLTMRVTEALTGSVLRPMNATIFTNLLKIPRLCWMLITFSQ